MSYLLTAVLALSLALPTITVAPTVLSSSFRAPVSAVSVVQEPRNVYLGPDGEPLPFENDEAIVDFLCTADIVERTKIDEGTDRAWKLLMEKDGVRAHAIFREVDITENDNPVGPCAAYEMAVLPGMDNQPPAVLRRVGRTPTPGSIQLWVEGAHSTDTADFNPPHALFGRQDPGSLRTDIAKDNVTSSSTGSRS